MSVVRVGSSGVFYNPLDRLVRFALKIQNCRFAFEVWVSTIIWLPIAVILSHNIYFPNPAMQVFSSIFKKLDSWIFRFTLCSETNLFYLKSQLKFKIYISLVFHYCFKRLRQLNILEFNFINNEKIVWVTFYFNFVLIHISMLSFLIQFNDQLQAITKV